MAKKTKVDNDELLTPEELKAIYDKTSPGKTIKVYQSNGESVKQVGVLDDYLQLTTVEIKKLRWFLSQITCDTNGRLYFKTIPCSISKEIWLKMVAAEPNNIK